MTHNLYKLGMVIGRFQVLHNGHVTMVRRALDLCDVVVVYIGSSQEARTKVNPFSYEERREMFAEVFTLEITCGRLIIRPLPDIGVGNNEDWGAYVLNIFEKEFHRLPDLYVSGCEKERSSWFTNELAPNTDELRMTRHNIEVSGTLCRATLKAANYDKWCELVPYNLFNKFEEYKNILDLLKETSNEQTTSHH